MYIVLFVVAVPLIIYYLLVLLTVPYSLHAANGKREGGKEGLTFPKQYDARLNLEAVA